MTVTDLWLRLRALFVPSRLERELDDELSLHLEMQTRKHVTAGLSEPEARRRAHAQFGSTANTEDACRDARGIPFFDTLWQDIRYAVRTFRRAPAFAAMVVATIGLGIGVNAAVFTIFDAYLLRPVDVVDPYSLYEFTWTTRSGAGHSFTWPEFEAFQESNEALDGTFASRKQFATRIDGRPALGELVSDNYFQTLGVTATLGRLFGPEDVSSPRNDAIVVLSHSAWERIFSSDPNIVGHTIRIQGYPVDVIGVARRTFTGLGELPYDFWAPLTLSSHVENGADLFGPDHPGRLGIVGRLKRSVTPRSAEAALLVWAQRMTADRTAEEHATGIRLFSRATTIPLVPQLVLTFSPIFMAFALVMLIACANVACMLLARGLARQREIRVRLSLGASRSRLVRQFITEDLMLALLAAAFGVVIARLTVGVGLRAIFSTIPNEYADYLRVVPLVLDVRVLAFVIAAAMVSVLLFGLVPALQVTRPAVLQSAHGNLTYDPKPIRFQHKLVAAQMAGSVLLVVCAAVLLRGSNRMDRRNVGMRTQGVIEIDIQERTRSLVLRTLADATGIQLVAATSFPSPLSDTPPRVSIGRPSVSMLWRAAYRFASPEYFALLDIPLIAGRTFTKDEATAGAPVAIVSEATARAIWADESPVGQSLAIVANQTPQLPARIERYQTVQVIGVARNVAAGYAGETSGLYLPTSTGDAGTALLVRLTGDPERGRQILDRALTSADPSAIIEIHRLQEFAEVRLFPFRIAYWLSAATGALALTLTFAGIYGVLSFVVAQRRKEIGIRMALGASVLGVTKFVLGQSLRFAATGIAIGATVALGVSTLLASQLVMMRALDGPAYFSAIAIVLASCLAAGAVPTFRAARIDPIETLRHD